MAFLKPWKQEVHVRFNFTCQCCGAKEDPNKPTLQVHHITPRSENGSNDPSNTILLCDSCHKSTHKRVEKKKKYYEEIFRFDEAYRRIGNSDKTYHYYKHEKIHRKERREMRIKLKRLR